MPKLYSLISEGSFGYHCSRYHELIVFVHPEDNDTTACTERNN